MGAALQSFGFAPFFSQQLSVEEGEITSVGRVTEVQRSLIVVTDGEKEWTVHLTPSWQRAASIDRPTVGDWIVMDAERTRIERILERKSVFRRLAAGNRTEVQLIAANIDTLFVVSSCNDEFNESRLERYLTLCAEPGVTPVVVLTKIDLTDNPENYVDRARSVQPNISVELVNARDPETLSGVKAWIGPGSTIALVGSSGVGKSTLLNALAGESVATTSDIREHDKKGRHTTSHRTLYQLPGGGLMIDVPGMRELRVAEIDHSLGTVFEEIEKLAVQCQFGNCSHQTEPGCAVRQALEGGQISERRLQNYLKLLRENAHNSASLAEKRSSDRELSKLIKQATFWKQGKKSL